MTLTPRQYETLGWMEENDCRISGLTGGCYMQNLQGKSFYVHGNTINGLRRGRLIEWVLGYYKISPLGVRALREYEKGKK